MTNTPFETILNNYAAGLNAYDEMRQADGQIQPHWQPLMQALAALGPDELLRRQQEARRQLRENGVTYTVHGDSDNQQRPWPLDVMPLIISQEDWQVIEAGLKQRAELLNMILTDIYGERQLLKAGLLPPELIYGHRGFLRQCDGVLLPGRHQLIIYAADLARGPDGQMWVLSDRTQAPSGAGYALENRTVLSRVLSGIFKDHKVARLSNFFRALQTALVNLTPQRSPAARTVIMTPGPHNETYFEHAYLAAYLGYSLVQGDDLTVRRGAVALKTLEGLQPVDVIVRRVDDLFCDPLELREDSRLGVAGLLEAARRQNIVIVNPLGSSVLENPGLLPFLPGLARQLLGEELILPAAATWWCGQPQEMKYVLDNLSRLVIKKLSRAPQSRTIFGDELTAAELDALREEIKAQPLSFVGQERISFSTAPSLVSGHVEPRHTVLRSFLVAAGDDYAVMPGGLTRSAAAPGDFMVSNRAGGISKDTWVLSNDPHSHTSLWLQADRTERVYRSSQHLPSRAAENLFWVGRYAERAEASARLLRVILTYVNEGEPLGDNAETDAATLPYLLAALTHITMTYPGFVGKGSKSRLARPEKELLAVALDTNRAGSLRSNLRAMENAAYAVRNLWSTDTWRVLDGIDGPWSRLSGRRKNGLGRVQSELNHLITRLMAFAGLNTESMTHEAGWLLLDMGRRLERALLTMSLIRATLGYKAAQPVEYQLLDALLRTTENVITYRRRYRSFLQVQTVLDLLLLDATNPRSLTYQLDRLQEHINQLPRPRVGYRLSDEERLALDASTRLRLANTADLVQTAGKNAFTRHTLDGFMADLAALLSQLSPVITQTYFTHAQSPYQLLSPVQPESPPEAGSDAKHVA